jgi:hypothetical protein
MSNELSFDNPDELAGLLEEGQAVEVIDHQEVVAQVQKNAKAKSAGKPQGESLQQHPGAIPLPHEKRQQSFSVNGKMLSKAEYDLYCQGQNPDLYNFLLKVQKLPEIIDPDGPQAVGGDIRAPDMEALSAAVGHICPHCQREIEEEECSSFKDIGTLIYYGNNESGEPLIWHFGCWETQILLWTRGNAEKAAEKFGGTILELLVWRRESGYNWQRLGMVRGD